MIIRCLVIDRNPIFRQELGEFIKSFRDDFQVQTVANALEATEAIAAADLSLVLCELPLMGLNSGLVSCIVDKKPPVPLLIIGRDDSPHTAGLSALGCVKGFASRLMQPAELAGKVVLALDRYFFQGNVRGVSCSSFIQILEQNCSDCILRVINSEEDIEGLLFFKNGVLIDAVCGTNEALEAVKRVLSWQSTDIELYNFCPLRKNRINATTAMLVLQGEKKPARGERPKPVIEMKTSPKSTNKSVGGLAGLFLEKAKKKR
jgi:CheY-like chemotaxis protein